MERDLRLELPERYAPWEVEPDLFVHLFNSNSARERELRKHVDQHPQLRHIATEDLRDFIRQATAILKAIHERGDRKSAERLLVQERIPLILKPYRIPPSLIPQCLALTDQPKETLWFQFIYLTLKRKGLKGIVPCLKCEKWFYRHDLKMLYCSYRCKNAACVSNWRKRKRAERKRQHMELNFQMEG